jgi:hypothetical protein
MVNPNSLVLMLNRICSPLTLLLSAPFPRNFWSLTGNKEGNQKPEIKSGLKGNHQRAYTFFPFQCTGRSPAALVQYNPSSPAAASSIADAPTATALDTSSAGAY